jgi:hypothetical protein
VPNQLESFKFESQHNWRSENAPHTLTFITIRMHYLPNSANDPKLRIPSSSRQHITRSNRQSLQARQESLRILKSQCTLIRNTNKKSEIGRVDSSVAVELLSEDGLPTVPYRKRGRRLNLTNRLILTNKGPANGTNGNASQASLRLKDGCDHTVHPVASSILEDDEEEPIRKRKKSHYAQPSRLQETKSTATLGSQKNGSNKARSATTIARGRQGRNMSRASVSDSSQSQAFGAQRSLRGQSDTTSGSTSPAVSPFQRSRVPSPEDRSLVDKALKPLGPDLWFARNSAGDEGDLYSYEGLDWPLPEYLVPDDEELDNGVSWSEQRQHQMADDDPARSIKLYLFREIESGARYNDSGSVRAECGCIPVCSDEAGSQGRNGLDSQVHILEKQSEHPNRSRRPEWKLSVR